MKINVFNNYGNLNVDIEKICSDLEKTFFEMLKTTEEVSLILVDLNEITRINQEYRHLNMPTDVISFEDRDEEYLGDIFICCDKAFAQAELYQHSPEREFAFLLCHGLLHLHGYDHLTKDDEEKMFKMQNEILSQTNYKR